MNLLQLILLLAFATLSIAEGCPFAKFAKPGKNGVPELDQEKVSQFVAKMKEIAPKEGSNLPDDGTKLFEKLHAGFDFASHHPEAKVDL